MILFVATDAGGAKELIPVIKEAKAKNKEFEVIGSDVTIPIFSDFGIEAKETSITSKEEADKLLNELNPSSVCIGTTGVIKAERYLTQSARDLNIKTVAALDEWYNYALRFEDEDKNIGKYLPDIICVQDEISLELAKAEGLPEANLKITGSVSLSELSKLKSPEFPEILKPAGDRTSILFVSEPLKRAYGEKPGDEGTHGGFLGFHEEIVRQLLADHLSKLDKEFFVLEKMHPSQKDTLDSPECGPNVEWVSSADPMPIIPLLWHADLVVGMRSKALLEAAILGKKPISIQPNTDDPEKCTAVRLGVCELQTDELNLVEGSENQEIPEFPFADEDAAVNVLNLLLT
mgnify:CR=1 FL=1